MLEKMTLKDKLIVITGCGYKPAEHIFTDIVTGKPSHDAIYVDETEMKLNVGAGIAKVLAQNNASVLVVSKTESKLKNLQQKLIEQTKNKNINYAALDLLNQKQVNDFVKKLPKDKTIYWVQSVGLGAGSYKVKDGNPYLKPEDIPLELMQKESEIVLGTTHIMFNALYPILKKQKESRIVVITSMSAIRGYSLGCTHCAAKGAIDRYTNSLMLAKYKENIFVTAVRPGGVDTGMYDNEVVQDAVNTISDEYNAQYRKHQTYMAPTVVGEVISTIFTIDAHIPSVNIVAKGQWPNEGS